jgi:hypothetical protein
MAVRRWNSSQIRVALDDQELISGHGFEERVYQETEGWHFLLQAMFKDWSKSASAEENLERFRLRRADGLIEAFLGSLEVLADERYKRTLGVLYMGSFPRPEISKAKLDHDGKGLFPDYECPSDIDAFVEYLLRMEFADLRWGKVEVQKMLGEACSPRIV